MGPVNGYLLFSGSGTSYIGTDLDIDEQAIELALEYDTSGLILDTELEDVSVEVQSEDIIIEKPDSPIDLGEC